MGESTVKVHIRNIMKKLSATNRTQVAYLTRGFFDGTLQCRDYASWRVRFTPAFETPAYRFPRVPRRDGGQEGAQTGAIFEQPQRGR